MVLVLTTVPGMFSSFMIIQPYTVFPMSRFTRKLWIYSKAGRSTDRPSVNRFTPVGSVLHRCVSDHQGLWLPDGDDVGEENGESEEVDVPQTHKPLQSHHDHRQNHLGQKQSLGQTVQLQVQQADLWRQKGQRSVVFTLSRVQPKYIGKTR